jgi:hypothetical protein
MKRMLSFLAAALIAGCSAQQPTPVASSPSTALGAPSSTVAAPATVTVTPARAPTPQAVGRCSDDDLSVISGTMQSADTQRHVVVSFINVSPTRAHSSGIPEPTW